MEVDSSHVCLSGRKGFAFLGKFPFCFSAYALLAIDGFELIRI